jgi:hypothetical protein
MSWEPGFLNGGGNKPKGMHWRTFERLQALHSTKVHAYLGGIMARFGKSVETLDRTNRVTGEP